MCFAVSIRGEGTSVGIGKYRRSEIHWLLALEKTLTSLAGRLAGGMVAGAVVADIGELNTLSSDCLR